MQQALAAVGLHGEGLYAMVSISEMGGEKCTMQDPLSMASEHSGNDDRLRQYLNAAKLFESNSPARTGGVHNCKRRRPLLSSAIT